MGSTKVYLVALSAMVLVCICAGANLRLKRSDGGDDSNLDANGFCITERSWQEDCNRCWCAANGAPACTLKGCIHLPPPTVITAQIEPEKEKKYLPAKPSPINNSYDPNAISAICKTAGANLRLKRSTSENDLNLDANGRCVTARNWKNDCNDCSCVANGLPACTLKGCVVAHVQTAPETEQSAANVEEKCVPGSKWTDECSNSCWCTDDRVSVCTKIGCSKTDKK